MRGAGLFGRLFPKSGTPPLRIVDLGEVEGPLYAIGDLHGCRKLLHEALEGIVTDADGAQPTVVLLGDLVDRGPDSAGVLDDLTRMAEATRVTSVLGNHERMMLSFLDDPLRSWDWLREGGFETLRSYGLSLSPMERLPLRRVRQMLAAHIPDQHVAWLKTLAHAYRARVGEVDYLFSHAGIDGARPLHAQREETLLWGHDVTPAEGICVVQGHVIVKQPLVSPGLIRIDTGAYVSGVLTAIRLSVAEAPRLLSFVEQNGTGRGL